MTDTSLATTDQPSHQALAAQGRSAPGKVTGRLRKAIDAMVWQGARRAEAAAIAGLTDHSLRSALRKPHVKAAYLSECEVLRLSGRARRIHRLEAMVEQDDNKAAVINAALALDRIGEEQQLAARSTLQAPGFMIQVIVQQPSPMPHMQSNEAKPLIEHEHVPHEGVERER